MIDPERTKMVVAAKVDRRTAFALLGSVQVTLIATITVITVALPAIQRDLRLDASDVVFVSSAYGLSFGGLLMFGGRLADLYGHRRILVVGLVGFGTASLVAGLSPELWVLIVARFAQGAGAALAAPAAMALVGSVFPEPPRRTRAMALWGVFASIGASVGTVVSGVAVTWVSWHWLFLAPGALGLALAVAAHRVMPSGVVPRPTGIDVPGAILGTVGLTSLIYGLSRVDPTWMIAGGVVLAAFVVVQARAANPLLPLAFLASAQRAVALLAICLTAGGMASTYLMLSLYFQQVRGFSPMLTAAAFIPPGLAVLISGPLTAWALGRVRPRTLTAVGLALTGAGLALLTGLGTETPYAGTLLAGLLIFPIGAGITFSSATVAVVENVPIGQSGLAGGVANTAMEVGPPLGLAVLLPLAATHAVDAGAARGYAFALGIAAGGFALTTVLALIRRGPTTK